MVSCSGPWWTMVLHNCCARLLAGQCVFFQSRSVRPAPVQVKVPSSTVPVLSPVPVCTFLAFPSCSAGSSLGALPGLSQQQQQQVARQQQQRAAPCWTLSETSAPARPSWLREYTSSSQQRSGQPPCTHKFPAKLATWRVGRLIVFPFALFLYIRARSAFCYQLSGIVV